jgi:hypothetical protein
MSFPRMTARYYKRWSDWYHRDISYPQLLVLHVAANYKLRPSGSGWWADGCKWPDNFVKTHSPSTIKSLLKRGLLVGNSRGERVAVGDLNKGSTKERPLLWTSAKGRALLDKITIETGLVFDKVNYQLVEPGQREETDGLELGHFDSEREADLGCDRAAILLEGDDVPTHFPSEESENIFFSNQVIRQIHDFKEGRGWLH